MSVDKRMWTTRKGEAKETWVVRYTDAGGTRRLKTFGRKKDAEKYQDTVRSDVRKGIHVAPSESIKIADAADKWIKRVEADGRERTTVRQYRQHANLHIVPRLGTIKLANLTRKRIEQFRDGLLVGEGEFEEAKSTTRPEGDDEPQVPAQGEWIRACSR